MWDLLFKFIDGDKGIESDIPSRRVERKRRVRKGETKELGDVTHFRSDVVEQSDRLVKKIDRIHKDLQDKIRELNQLGI